MLGCRDVGMQGGRVVGVQGCRDSGMQGCRDAGMQDAGQLTITPSPGHHTSEADGDRVERTHGRGMLVLTSTRSGLQSPKEPTPFPSPSLSPAGPTRQPQGQVPSWGLGENPEHVL